ncbi:MAG: UDP-N-acetylmuramoyl-L-alanine--D-glutamate ligase [Leptospiraceae bacterium]|nr:UDP-N-acetylmuramoyl-L-alanine--D-glutamate ligase [Leptospiraceae bacterium]
MQEILQKKIYNLVSTPQPETVAILGGGVTGNAVAEFLKKKQIPYILIDASFQENQFPNFSDKDFQVLPSFSLLVKSPGISPKHHLLQECKKRNIPILSEIELARMFCKARLIGITGTDGKSTTTALTAHLIQGKYSKTKAGGNVGLPFISISEEDLDFVVLELSSYQLEDSGQLHLNAAALLNIAPDHLERHGTMENYIQAKMKIFDFENPSHLAVLNFRQKEMFPIPQSSLCKVKYFGNSRETEATIDSQNIITKQFTYNTKNFPLKGKHNLENLAAAILLAEYVGVEPEIIQSRLENFSGLSHRFQKFLEYEGYTFINDSKSTNLHSMLSGIQGYENKFFILILGGIPKQEPLEPLIQTLLTLNVEIFMFGKMCEIWNDELELKLKKKIISFSRLDDLIQFLMKNLKKYPPCDVIFSPAGASFDQFKNFEERGNFFMKEVLRVVQSTI